MQGLDGGQTSVVVLVQVKEILGVSAERSVLALRRRGRKP